MTEPPAYTRAPESFATGRRSIVDLRAQIIANGSIIRPSKNSEASEHIEVIVAKTPPPGPTPWTEGQIQAMKQSALTVWVPPEQRGAAPSSSASSSTPAGWHYAVLAKRSGFTGIDIILKGEPKETVEEALEWLLDRTETLVHNVVIKRKVSS